MNEKLKRMDYIDSYGDVIRVSAHLDMYRDNDNLFVGLTCYDEDLEAEDSYCSLTVNVDKLPYLHSAIDTTYNGEGKLKFLKDKGFGEPTGQYVHSGFCSYPVFRFYEDKLMEIEPDMFQIYAATHNQVVEKKESLDKLISNAEKIAEEQAGRMKSGLDDCRIER